MKFILTLLLVFGFLTGCAASKQPSFGFPKYKQKETRKHKTSAPRKKTEAIYRQSRIPKLSNNPFPQKSLPKESHGMLPTHLNLRDRSPMVLIHSGDSFVPPSHSASVMAKHNESGSFRRPLQPFYIDRNEITVKQFKRFDPKYDEKPFTENQPCPSCPAMAIDWESADGYCKWAKKRLPTKLQWETAARGQYSTQAFPWGEKFLPGYANLGEEEDDYFKVAPTGSFPKGASPFGVMDMAGNVWEWVAETKSITKNENRSGEKFQIAKGGGWTTSPKAANLSTNHEVPAEAKIPTVGFRCVKPATIPKRHSR